MSQILQIVRGQSIDLRKDTRKLVIATSRVIQGGGGVASALATTGASVNVSAAAPPTAGQVLTATSAIAATWQDPAGGGGGGTLNTSYNFGGAGAGRVITADSGAFEVVTDGIGEGATVSIRAINNDPAVDGTQQHSPAYEWAGKGFATGPDESQDVRMIVQLEPIQGVANPTGQLRFSHNIDSAGFVSAGIIDFGVGVGAQWRMPPGTNTRPAYSFGPGTQQIRTGVDFDAPNGVRIVADGNLTLRISPNDVTANKPFRGTAGSALAPAYSWAIDTISGLFLFSVGVPIMATGGLEAMRWDGSQNTIAAQEIRLATGKRLQFNDNLNTNFQATNETTLRQRVGGTIVGSAGVGGFQDLVQRNVNIGATGQTQQRGLGAENQTAALIGAASQRWSPMMTHVGRGFATVPNESQDVQFGSQLEPIQGADNPTSRLQFKSRIDGAAWVNAAALTSDGRFVGVFSSSLSTPTFEIAGLSGTGLNAVPGPEVTLISGGVRVLRGFTTRVVSALKHTFQNGSAASPGMALEAAQTVGFFGVSGGLGVATGGLEAMQWDSSQNTIPAANIVMGQGQRLVLNTNAFIRSPATNLISIATANVTRINIGSFGIDLQLATQLFQGGIGTAATEGFSLRNTTPAAAGVQQFSGLSVLQGEGWETDGGSSQVVKFGTQCRPVQGAANPTGLFAWMVSIENVSGGAYADVGTLSSDGDLAIEGGLGVNGSNPAVQQTYVVTNPSTDRAFDASTATLAELRNVVGTIITDLQSPGLFG